MNNIKNERKRPAEDDLDANNSAKRKPAFKLFRPWCDEPTKKIKSQNEEKKAESVKTAEAPLKTAARSLLTPDQLALLQEQSKVALALQQTYYQRQMMMMNHIWTQQHQQHVLQMMYQYQQFSQRLRPFVFGQQR